MNHEFNKLFRILKEKFKDLMRSLSSNYHRQLRNDILVIVTMIASCSENAPITQTGFILFYLVNFYIDLCTMVEFCFVFKTLHNIKIKSIEKCIFF